MEAGERGTDYSAGWKRFDEEKLSDCLLQETMEHVALDEP
jgi:hypothetical protein